ncbi:MAG: nuclease [Clostridiales bacterium GWF2_38_85]|nr:MAG: nuclease [Clostridiales bacterium GWF2_38_85]HBL84714.1 nuclease [Clostridiales bacterium]
MREKTIERKFVNEVKKLGGLCPKFVSPGFDGMPDRLVLLPDGYIAFVEVKSMGCKPRALQVTRHKQLRQLGFRVYVLDDTDQIQKIISEMGCEPDGT